MKRKIYAKFKSKCAETGRTISKGEPIIYDPVLRLAYCQHSETFKTFTAEEDNRDQVQDPGEQWFDNWAQQNGI